MMTALPKMLVIRVNKFFKKYILVSQVEGVRQMLTKLMSQENRGWANADIGRQRGEGRSAKGCHWLTKGEGRSGPPPLFLLT